MNLNIVDGEKHSGKFIFGEHELDGEITFACGDTHLYVHSPNFFRPDANLDRCIQGRLHDLTCISLFDCLTGRVPGSSWSPEGSFEFAKIRPHYVLHGRRHLRPDEAIIKEIAFQVSDANSIFQDYDAFLSAIRPTQEQIRSLTRSMSKDIGRKISMGARPQIAFFTGKEQIFRVKTIIGTVFTSHSPIAAFGGPEGVSINNRIWTGISFSKPVTFGSAVESITPVLQFLQIIAGRTQEVSNVTLTLNARDPTKRQLDVYWCFPPRRPGQARSSRTPHVVDLPLDAVRDSKLFSTVLREWLTRHQTWLAARARFEEGFAKEQWYDTDRLVGAANMFDLLPVSAVPVALTLPTDIRQAYEQSRALFLALPKSPERDSVLNALGRVNMPNLKRKIRHRATPVVGALGGRLPRLLDVLDLAVDARNHFVHGTASNVDFSGGVHSSLHFLTDALEFVFALSDLHEAGWQVTRLVEHGTVQSHPFGTFYESYDLNLQRLQSSLPKSHRLSS